MLVHTLFDHWLYLAEGNAAIVFSYRGPSHPVLTSSVLRLRKSSSNHPSALVPDDDDPIISFQRTVITRLIDPRFLVRLDLVDLDPAWLRAFASFHNPSRPQKNRESSSIDLSRSKAVLADDLVGPFACALEIKAGLKFLINICSPPLPS
jgi:inositol-pentakisphosphate 2-kinase